MSVTQSKGGAYQPTVMYEKPNMFGGLDMSSSENANPWGAYNSYKKALEDYYGQAKPETVQDPDAVYPKDRSHFPEAFTGPNTYMKRLLLAHITEQQQWPSREAMPLTAYDGNPHVVWSEIEFHNHVLDVNPEETLTRTLTFEQRQNEGFIHRYGANFQMIHGFYLTQEGKARYAAHIHQIANMTITTINYGVLNVLFNTAPYKDPHARSRVDNPLTNSDITSRFHEQKATFGALQKSFTNYKMILNKAQTAAQNRNNVEGDLFIWPSNAAQYVNDQPVNNTFITSGHKNTDSVDVFDSNKYRQGAKFRFSRPFVLESNRPAIDPSLRNITIGGFVCMTSEGIEGALSSKKFSWPMMDVMVYDENSDTNKRLSFKRYFQYGGLFKGFGEQSCMSKKPYKPQKSIFGQDDFGYDNDEYDVDDDSDSGSNLAPSDIIGQYFFKGHKNWISFFDSHTSCQDLIELHYKDIQYASNHGKLLKSLITAAALQNRSDEESITRSIKSIISGSSTEDIHTEVVMEDDVDPDKMTMFQIALRWAFEAEKSKGYLKIVEQTLSQIFSSIGQLRSTARLPRSALPSFDKLTQPILKNYYSEIEAFYWKNSLSIFAGKDVVGNDLLDAKPVKISAGSTAVITTGGTSSSKPKNTFKLDGVLPVTLSYLDIKESKLIDDKPIFLPTQYNNVLLNLEDVLQKSTSLDFDIPIRDKASDEYKYAYLNLAMGVLFQIAKGARSNMKKSAIVASKEFTSFSANVAIDLKNIKLEILPVQAYTYPIQRVLLYLLDKIIDQNVPGEEVINLALVQTSIQQAIQFRFIAPDLKNSLSPVLVDVLNSQERYDKFDSYSQSNAQTYAAEASAVLEELIKTYSTSKSTTSRVAFGGDIFEKELVDIYSHLMFLARDRANLTGNFGTVEVYKASFKNVVNQVLTVYSSAQNSNPFKTVNLYLNALLTFLENGQEDEIIKNGLLNPADNDAFVYFMVNERNNEKNSFKLNDVFTKIKTPVTSGNSFIEMITPPFDRKQYRREAEKRFCKYGRDFVESVIIGWQATSTRDSSIAFEGISIALKNKNVSQMQQSKAIATAAYAYKVLDDDAELQKYSGDLDPSVFDKLLEFKSENVDGLRKYLDKNNQRQQVNDADFENFQFTKDSYREILRQFPINGVLVQWCFDNDVYFPIDLKIFWPHERYESASGMLIQGNGATGKTLYADPEFMLASEAGQMKHYWHWAARLGFLVFRPDYIVPMNNIIINDYKGGRGVRPFDPLDVHEVRKYREGLITSDCFVIPERIDKRGSDILLDITGSFHPELNPNESAQKSTAYTLAPAMASIWGWSSHSRKHPLDDQYINEDSSPEYNTMVWSNWHACYNPVTGAFDKESPETGHLRDCIYEGSGQVRRGAQMFYRGNDVSIRLK